MHFKTIFLFSTKKTFNLHCSIVCHVEMCNEVFDNVETTKLESLQEVLQLVLKIVNFDNYTLVQSSD